MGGDFTGREQDARANRVADNHGDSEAHAKNPQKVSLRAGDRSRNLRDGRVH